MSSTETDSISGFVNAMLKTAEPDEGLGFTELLGQWLLFNAGILPHSNKHGYEPGIFCRFERLLHAPPRPGIGGSKFDPEKGLSQNWILSAKHANLGFTNRGEAAFAIILTYDAGWLRGALWLRPGRTFL